MKNAFDFVVVGIGSMGSAATYFLAQQGYRVLGIDQFAPPHDLGSHAGQSRIIRKAYFEHPDYVPLLERSYWLWREFERQTGKKYYYDTGIVYFGDEAHPTMKGVRTSAKQYNVAVDVYDFRKSQHEFPQFNIPGSYQTLVEPDAGFVRPEFAIQNYLVEAEVAGATLKTGEKVLTWDQSATGATVKTDKATYACDKVILAGGSWMASLVPQLEKKLTVTRQTLAWIDPREPERFALGNFPCWFIEDPALGMFYGFPVLPYENFGGPIGMKIASHRPGEVTDPDHVDRKTLPAEENAIKTVLSKYFRGAGEEIISLKTCLYTYSPDENFIIDILPGTNGRVVVAAGFSGHGFKFVPVIGEVISDLAVKGKTLHPIEFLSLKRLL
ncbi:MAG TPA: N-methyl-L-tryptophan oxidase [Chryseosolibacter sp.]